jgi:hypothetical protein
MALGSIFTKTYTTYSGVDITAIFDNIALSTLTGIAISVTREKAPVYTFGSANPRSISRGKRGTAGSMMFTLFDRDAFYGLFLSEDHKYFAHADEINWLTNPINASMAIGLYYQNFQGANNGVAQGGQLTGFGRTGQQFSVDQGNLDRTTGQPLNPAPAVVNQGANPLALQAGQQSAGGFVGARTVKRSAQYADQVMPFDITMIAQNEYGHASASGVIGVEVINEGGGISMDDITNEQQMTYIAIYRLPWYSLNNGQQKESIYGSTTSLTDSSQVGATISTATQGNNATVLGQSQ